MSEQVLVPLQDVEKMAVAVASSGLFGMKTKEQAMALMLLAQAEGIHPMTAARDYHIIQGRPALKSDAMLARFQQSGGVVRWVSHKDDLVSAYFSHPSCPDPILIEWDTARAKQAGLCGKDNWKNYPRQMLRARVISEGVRATFPGVCVGVYTPEEVETFEPLKTVDVVAVPTNGKPEVAMPKAKEAPATPEDHKNQSESMKRVIGLMQKAFATKKEFEAWLVKRFESSDLDKLSEERLNMAASLMADIVAAKEGQGGA